MINLDKIFLYLFVYIVEAGILWLYIHDVFDLKYSRILKTSLISIGYGILFLLSFANSLLLNTVIFSLINFIILKVLCTAKCAHAFFHALILTTSWVSQKQLRLPYFPILMKHTFIPTFI